MRESVRERGLRSVYVCVFVCEPSVFDLFDLTFCRSLSQHC